MFSESKKAKSTTTTNHQQNRITQGTKIVGNMESEGGFRIDGEIEGDVNAKGKVVIGTTGKVKGTLVCGNADIEGEFIGKLHVLEVLSLKPTAHVQGDVKVSKLVVESGAIFDVTSCAMGGAVKELNGTSGQQKKEKTA